MSVFKGMLSGQSGAVRAAVLAAVLMALPLAAQSPAPHGGYGPLVLALSGGPGASFLGVNICEVDAERAKALKLPDERGVEITRVESDSPAEKAGLKVGDVVLEYNGERVEGMEQFGRMVRETPAGRKVTLQISRGGALQTLTAVIASHRFPPGGLTVMPQFEMPEIVMPDIPEGFSGWRSGMLGVETESLNPQLAEFFGVKQGVLVRSVMSGSAAEKAGIKAGDVITKADDKEVTTPGQVSAAVRAARNKHSLTLHLMRNHRELNVTATLEEDHSGWPGFPDAEFVNRESRK
jgi:serine protease Do